MASQDLGLPDFHVVTDIPSECKLHHADEVVIIGGGAAGLAVIIRLIEKVKEGSSLKSITVVEKNPSVGPGLAYAEGCSGTNVNMKADLMGLDVDDVKHFSRWIRMYFSGNAQQDFPLRSDYGQYLSMLSTRYETSPII